MVSIKAMESKLPKLETAGITFLAAIAASTKTPFASNIPQQIVDTVGNMAGVQASKIVAGALPGTSPSGGSTPTISPAGMLNQFTYAGATLLLADYVLKASGISFPYRAKLSKYILKPFGTGLLAGGLIGGFFDPSPTNMSYIGSSAGRVAGVASLYRPGAPSLRAY